MTTSAAGVPPGGGDPPGLRRAAAAVEVVEALAGVALPSRFRDLAAEATGILRWAVAPTARTTVVAVLDSDAVAARLVALLDRLGVDDGVVHAEPARRRWRVVLGERHGAEVARRVGLVDAGGRPATRLPSWLVTGSLPEAVAAWRGALLAAGRPDVPEAGGEPAGEQGASVTLPCPSTGVARDLSGLGLRLGLRAHPTHLGLAREPALRVDGPGDAALLLASCGGAVTLTAAGLAPASTGPAAEAANATRAAVAASRTTATVADAFAVLEAAGVDVPAPLADAGRLRLRHPSRALVDLAALADPPTTKDALAGRLRRLAALAARHRAGPSGRRR